MEQLNDESSETVFDADHEIDFIPYQSEEDYHHEEEFPALGLVATSPSSCVTSTYETQTSTSSCDSLPSVKTSDQAVPVEHSESSDTDDEILADLNAGVAQAATEAATKAAAEAEIRRDMILQLQTTGNQESRQQRAAKQQALDEAAEKQIAGRKTAAARKAAARKDARAGKANRGDADGYDDDDKEDEQSTAAVDIHCNSCEKTYHVSPQEFRDGWLRDEWSAGSTRSKKATGAPKGSSKNGVQRSQFDWDASGLNKSVLLARGFIGRFCICRKPMFAGTSTFGGRANPPIEFFLRYPNSID